MKKKITKLQLRSETVRTLSGAKLAAVNGGLRFTAACTTTYYACDPPESFQDCPSVFLCDSYANCNLTHDAPCVPN
jgi:hypothetical protein